MAAKVSGRARIAGMGLRAPPGPTRNCCVQQVTGTSPFIYRLIYWLAN
jgi:hypothetical protein